MARNETPGPTEETPRSDTLGVVAADPDVTALLERLVRDGGALALAAAAGERKRLQPIAMQLTVSVACALALLTGFVFLNIALLDALHGVLSGWRAPLVLGAGWALLGLAALARVTPVRRIRALSGADGGDAAAEAEQRLRTTLEELTDTVARQAEQRLAEALLPITGRIVETGEDVIDAADEMIEAADEITDVIEERLPGGIVVNRVVDVALVPGRMGIRVARRVIEVGRPRD